MICKLSDVIPGQQITLDLYVELVVEVQEDGGQVILTYHDGRQTLPLPGDIEVMVEGAQLSIVQETAS